MKFLIICSFSRLPVKVSIPNKFIGKKGQLMLCNYPDRKQMMSEYIGKHPVKDSIKSVFAKEAQSADDKNTSADNSQSKKSKHNYVEDSIEAGEELLRKELCTIAIQHGMYRPYEARIYRFRNN